MPESESQTQLQSGAKQKKNSADMVAGGCEASDSSKVYEASWAPADPRDKLYDVDASKAEKAGSLYRVIAAFHPVLNVPVLLLDSFRRFGWLTAGLFWAGLTVLVVLFVIYK
ncbi:MAG: hypothetical protein JKY57_03600 [Kordiimonadaceae bacterium]|nr:hypothetical protein [Kordiimonadaceae bacterium]